MAILRIIAIILLWVNLAFSARIKDIATFMGVRKNFLIGYGLVVGLEGTGDSDDSPFTFRSILNMMKTFGITINYKDIDVDNVAGVVVTAELPPFAKAGMRTDAIVSSIGDAKSLQGGTLLLTPLKAPDGEIYAVAQGPISIGGLNVRAAGRRLRKNFPCVGRVPNGVIIEKDLPYKFNTNKIDLILNNPDFTTATRIEKVINEYIGENIALAKDPATVEIIIPEKFKTHVVDFVADIENLSIEPDTVAKVIINERTGTIVMGKDVRISTIAISHGNLVLKVTPKTKVEKTPVEIMKEMSIEEGEGNIAVIPEGVSIGDLVKALNALGVSPRDMISILQAIKEAGALKGELEIM